MKTEKGMRGSEAVVTSTATISLTEMELKYLFDFFSVLTISGNF